MKTKESNDSINVEEVKINIKIEDQNRERQAKIIEKWKKILKDLIWNDQKKSIEEKTLRDKTGKQ